MTWLGRLLHPAPTPPGEPGIRSVRFDMQGLRVERRDTDLIEWEDLAGDRVVAALQRDVEWGLAMFDLAALRDRCRGEAARRGGGIVALDLVPVAGLPAVRSIVKMPDLPSYAYEGALVVPLQGARFTLTLHTREHGVTGTREAAITGLLFQQGLLPLPSGRPGPDGGIRMERWFFDPYEAAYDGMAVCSLADDERYDAVFPKHPLSKVRAWLATTARSLAVDESARPTPAIDWEPSDGRTRIPAQVPSAAVARLFMMAGRLNLAEAVLAEAIPMSEGRISETSPDVAENLLFLGLLREGLGRLDDAEWAISAARDMFQSTVPADDLRSARAGGAMGRLRLLRGHPEEAEPMLRQALALFIDHRSSGDAAVTANDLGLVCQRRGDHRAAISWFETADSHFEKAEHASHEPISDRATVLANLGVSLDALGDRKGAKDARSRSAGLQHRAPRTPGAHRRASSP